MVKPIEPDSRRQSRFPNIQKVAGAPFWQIRQLQQLFPCPREETSVTAQTIHQSQSQDTPLRGAYGLHEEAGRRVHKFGQSQFMRGVALQDREKLMTDDILTA
jgi:hypothetical protein